MNKTSNENILKNIAYIFNRSGEKEILSKYKSVIVRLTESSNYFARMHAVNALSKIQDSDDIYLLIELLKNETDWRVKSNIINGLGNYKIDFNTELPDKISSVLLDIALKDGNDHLKISSLSSLGKLFSNTDPRNPQARKIQQNILFMLSPSSAYSPIVKAEAVKLYAKIFKDKAKDDLINIFKETDSYYLKGAIAESFGFMENGEVYKELRELISQDVQNYNLKYPNKDGSMIGSKELAILYKGFLLGLAELDDKLDEENRNITRLIFTEFSASKDPSITSICLMNLADSIYLNYRDETCFVMTVDYNSLLYPKDKDIMLMFIDFWKDMKYYGAAEILKGNLKINDYDIQKYSAEALKEILGIDYSENISAKKIHTDFDWEFIENLYKKKFATIKTSKGDIKIELDFDSAPFTVQNFVKLSESGYYNNTIFHRVIPNFVIQGGDPTGSGFGGPENSIRTEISFNEFDEYTIGMASSGLDTEGSQFFITHSAQPHLNGKYTVFGKVTEGKDAVNNIQIGDVIMKIEFSGK
jgi:cyclophilin family peptidyl-prolyl cis-trans isomerase